MPRKRGSLDPAFLEMCLFLRAQYDYIRSDIPTLSDEQAKAAIPNRLRDQAMLDEVNVLTFGAEEVSEDESDDLDDVWVLPNPAVSGGGGGGHSGGGSNA